MFQKMAVSVPFRKFTCSDLLACMHPANLEQLPDWVHGIPYLVLPKQEAPRVTVSAKPPPHHRVTSPSRHPVVALGGTFDHLHAGHKILLSMAAWIAERKIIVGVTGENRGLKTDHGI